MRTYDPRKDPLPPDDPEAEAAARAYARECFYRFIGRYPMTRAEKDAMREARQSLNTEGPRHDEDDAQGSLF